MNIDWKSLFDVAGVSLLFGVGIVVVFSLGLLGLSAAEGRRSDDDAPAGGAAAVPVSGVARTVGTGVAGVCFLACAAAVAYGIYLIVPQFH